MFYIGAFMMRKSLENDYTKAINNHYGQPNLGAKILSTLQKNGKNITNLTRDDIATFDEFHLGGRRATRELAKLANLHEGMHILDIGCGIGGPARTLAAEFGCHVTGIDLTKEYCITAELLTEHVGLSDLITFRHGNALNLPFEDEIFDVVWMQHVLMNIENKPQVFNEIHRVLQTGGVLALHEIMKGHPTPVYLPVFWANESALNYLLPTEDFKQMLHTCNYSIIEWENISDRAKLMIQKLHKTVEMQGLPPLGINVIVSTDVPIKIANTLQNLEEKNILVIQAVGKRNL